MIQIITAPNWQDYQLLDSGNGQRLEKFGSFILIRPDPQAIWKPKLSATFWQKFDAKFVSGKGERGKWVKRSRIPDKWIIRYKNLSFYCKLTPFKHTGIFPEQAAHWDWLSTVIASAVKQSSSSNNSNKIATNPSDFRNDKSINVLNLFGYTGGATLAAAATGAKVTHLDASYPAIGWARENSKASGLEKAPIRWILDDAIKFCQREVKRGVKYDGIIMDPPIYGHGPKGEVWNFNKDFPKLIEICRQLLSPKPLFFLVNAYAISASSLMLKNTLEDFSKNLGGTLESGELALKDNSNRLLSTGIFARLVFDESKRAKWSGKVVDNNY